MKQLENLLFFLLGFITVINCNDVDREESKASELVQEINDKQIIEVNQLTLADWNYVTNLTTENAEKKQFAAEEYAKFVKNSAMKLLNINSADFTNATLKRIIDKLTNIGDAILDPPDFNKMKDAVMAMQSKYATTKVPSFADKNIMYSLEPEITTILESSRNADEMKYYWEQWYELTGKPSRGNFYKYINLRNKAAKKLSKDFTSGAEWWLNSYEDETFEQQVESILEQLKPLYEQLHGYVRHKLFEFYGAEHVSKDGPIPIHLLGNMWGQKWVLGDITIPFKGKQKIDVTEEMFKQNYTPKKMFEMAESFFISINMTKLPQSFWEKSVLEKPNDNRELICHASAWDFAMNDDVRIKQCTRVTMESFITVHHEMGHIEYYLQYHNQPLVFRNGANPGFHEAIGDVISLSVSSTRHLKRVGLLKSFKSDREIEINQMLRLGLEKLAFLPFAFVMDKFRWDIFRGNVEPADANCYFWRLRVKYGGVEPATLRTSRDFDITAKYHASADVEYLRYFVSFIIQFQLHKAACIKAGEYEPNNPDKSLNNCDIYQSVEAGNALKSMLELGSSKPWPDALEAMTGQRQLDASAILEYFKPLEDWLLETNKELGVNIGWERSESEKAFLKPRNSLY